MTEEPRRRAWSVLLARMRTEPGRHRMALWRELRRAGAAPLGQATWALPDLPASNRPDWSRFRQVVT